MLLLYYGETVGQVLRRSFGSKGVKFGWAENLIYDVATFIKHNCGAASIL